MSQPFVELAIEDFTSILVMMMPYRWEELYIGYFIAEKEEKLQIYLKRVNSTEYLDIDALAGVNELFASSFKRIEEKFGEVRKCSWKHYDCWYRLTISVNEDIEINYHLDYNPLERIADYPFEEWKKTV